MIQEMIPDIIIVATTVVVTLATLAVLAIVAKTADTLITRHEKRKGFLSWAQRDTTIMHIQRILNEYGDTLETVFKEAKEEQEEKDNR